LRFRRRKRRRRRRIYGRGVLIGLKQCRLGGNKTIMGKKATGSEERKGRGEGEG